MGTTGINDVVTWTQYGVYLDRYRMYRYAGVWEFFISAPMYTYYNDILGSTCTR